MPADIGLLSAFIVGLLGGVHCAGMCGGIVGALTLGLPNQSPSRQPPFQLAYNLGRLSSYTLAGAIMGGLGAVATGLGTLNQLQLALQLLAGLFMISLGLYLPGWWRGLTRIEQLGGGIWKHLQPIGQKLMPVRSPGHALAVGALWGWLPCGLVYSVLIWSIATADPLYGAALMLAFGLGTLPTLLGMGMLASHLRGFIQSPATRAVAGLMVMGFGSYTLWLGIRPLLA